MTSSFSKFQNTRKFDLENVCMIICGTFHQNRPIRLGCGDDTHIQFATKKMRITYGILTKELDHLSMIFFDKTINNNIVFHYDRKNSYIFYSVAMESDVILKSSLVLISCLGCKTFIFRLRLYFSLQI